MQRNATVILLICLLCGCTENLRQKDKPKPTIYPPVHYSLKDTVAPKAKEPNTVSLEQEVGRTPKIVHKALCRYTKLSEEFDFALSVDVDVSSDTGYSCAYIAIFSKVNGKKLQTLKFNYEHGFSGGFYDCNARSFTTGFNKNAISDSGFLGDMVVGDLNFDKREGFAILWDYGAHSAWYRYYLQDDAGHFVFNKYLTNQLESFPTEFDTLNHTFEVDNIVGSWGYNLNAYKYDSKTSKFVEIKNQTFDGESGKMVSGWPKISKKKKR